MPQFCTRVNMGNYKANYVQTAPWFPLPFSPSLPLCSFFLPCSPFPLHRSHSQIHLGGSGGAGSQGGAPTKSAFWRIYGSQNAPRSLAAASFSFLQHLLWSKIHNFPLDLDAPEYGRVWNVGCVRLELGKFKQLIDRSGTDYLISHHYSSCCCWRESSRLPGCFKSVHGEIYHECSSSKYWYTSIDGVGFSRI